MNMTIEITGDLEPLLKAEAGKAGVAPEEYTSRLLRKSLLRRKPNAPVLSQEEARLLNEINQGLSAEEMERYAGLVHKRQDESIKPSELDELRRLTQKLEEVGVKRAEKLVRLAEVRGISVEALIEQLEIQAPDVV
jgi:hypothetical protein